MEKQTVSCVQQVTIDVVMKDGRKLLAINLAPWFGRKDRFYDNTLYFESMAAGHVADKGKVLVYRRKKLLDSSNVTVENINPHDSREGWCSVLNFKNLKTRKQYAIDVSEFQKGDRIVFDWTIEQKQKEGLEYFLERQELLGAIKVADIPIYVQAYFVQRAGFQTSEDGPTIPFTLFKKAI